MKQSLELKLGQKLAMTPQLQHAIRLLQLSVIDLRTDMQEALDSNPLLEVVETVEGPTETGECVLREGPCPGTESCPVHEAWQSARSELKTRLGSVSAQASLERQTT